MIKVKSIKVTTKGGSEYNWTAGTQAEYHKFLNELSLATHTVSGPQTSVGVGTINLRDVETVLITMES
jgi:hypothetical protein